jgi:hypothetical protein
LLRIETSRSTYWRNSESLVPKGVGVRVGATLL